MHQAERLLKLAGAVSEAAEVAGVEGVSSGVRIVPGGGISIEESTSSDLCVRMIRNGRLGLGAASGSGDLPTILDMAIAGSRAGMTVGWSFPPAADAGEIETRHPALAVIGIEDLAGLLLGIEDAIREQSPHAAVTGTICRRDLEIFLANTSGFQGSYGKSVIDLDLELSFPEKDGMLVQSLRFASGLPLASPRTICEAAVRVASESGRKVSVPRGAMPVVLSPAVLCALLQSFRAGVGARALLDRSSPLADRQGSRVAPAAVTLLDRPRLPYGAASAPFDAEGVPTHDRHLIREGILCGSVNDLATAAALGVEPTGNASRSPGEMPRPSCTNLVLEPGTASLGELLQAHESCVLIRELLPGSSGDALSGEFCFDVALAVLFDHGEPAGRIENLSMTGNALEMIGSIEAVESALYSVETDWLPSVLIPSASLESGA